MILLAAREWGWQGLGTDHWMNSLMLQTESIHCSPWRHSGLFHLRSGEHVASGWDYSQSHLCWKAFLFAPLVFHQIKELNHLSRQLQYYWSWCLQRKTPTSINEEKILVFSCLCELPAWLITQLQKCQCHTGKRLQQPQLRLTLLWAALPSMLLFRADSAQKRIIIIFFFLFPAYSLGLSEQNPTHKIQESSTGQVLHLHYPCKVRFLISRKRSVRTILYSQITKILNIVSVKLDLDSWRLIVPSCVFTALSRVFPAMLCAFMISSGALCHLQSTQGSVSLPSWCPLVQGRRQVLLGELRMKQNPSQGHPWPAGQGNTSEDLESGRASIMQRPGCAERLFITGKKRWGWWSLHACENILLPRQKELFSTTECKGGTEHQLFWFSFQGGEIKYKPFHMRLLRK